MGIEFARGPVMRYIILILFFVVSVPGWVIAGENKLTVEQELKDYFFAAARLNDVLLLKEFVGAGFPVDVTNTKGYTALMIATYHGNTQAFDYLVSQNANTCVADQKGNTALMAAIFRGEFSLAKKLLSYDCDAKHKNKAGNSAVEFAQVFGREQILMLLNRRNGF